jgi:hypothetical protein
MVISRISESAFMALGLEYAGDKRWNQQNHLYNVESFKAWYAASPKTCEEIWVDLQMAPEEEGRIDSDANPLFLLLALCFLKGYSTERKLACMFNMNEKTVRKWCASFTRKVQLLKVKKVSNQWQCLLVLPVYMISKSLSYVLLDYFMLG